MVLDKINIIPTRSLGRTSRFSSPPWPSPLHTRTVPAAEVPTGTVVVFPILIHEPFFLLFTVMDVIERAGFRRHAHVSSPVYSSRPGRCSSKTSHQYSVPRKLTHRGAHFPPFILRGVANIALIIHPRERGVLLLRTLIYSLARVPSFRSLC